MKPEKHMTITGVIQLLRSFQRGDCDDVWGTFEPASNGLYVRWVEVERLITRLRDEAHDERYY